MTYKEFIDDILECRGRFNCGEEYHERHHIVPKCIGGSNDNENLIDLYAREHFIAHKLLAQENSDNSSLVYAYGCMAWAENKNQERYEVSQEDYEKARIALSNSLKGKPKSEEHKRHLSEAKKGKPVPRKTQEKAIAAVKGKPFTDEHKINISNALKGIEFSDEHKANISKSKKGKCSDAQKLSLAKVSENNKGRKHTEEAKRKISAGNKGKVQTNSVKIGQYDMESNELISIYKSIMIAHNETGISYDSIWRCIKRGRKSAGGFYWKAINN